MDHARARHPQEVGRPPAKRREYGVTVPRRDLILFGTIVLTIICSCRCLPDGEGQDFCQWCVARRVRMLYM